MSHTVSVTVVPVRSISALHSTIAALAATGINISLEENAEPRNYYADQYQRHLKRPNEIADFVIRIPDAYYDIGLIKQDDGTYSVNFDDYGYAGRPGARGGSQAIKDILGIKPPDGATEHWAGQKTNPEQAMHSIAKFLRTYTEHATLEIAASSGMILEQYVPGTETTPTVMTFAGM